MVITVLGTVSPHCTLFHNCPGFLVSSDNSKILLDAGNGITSFLGLPDDLKDLSVIISHLHKDHYADLLVIGYASYCYHKLGKLKDKVIVYLPKIYEHSKELLDYRLIKEMKEQYFNTKDYSQRSKLTVDNLNVSFLKNFHDDMESYSIKVSNQYKKVVYTGDMGHENIDKIVRFAKNADLLIAESSLRENETNINKNHLSAYRAGEIARLAKVKELLLTHFPPEVDRTRYLKEAKKNFSNTHIAYERKVICL